MDYLSISRLSRESNVCRSTLQRIASGKVLLENCKDTTLTSIANALEISNKDLLSFENEESYEVIPAFLKTAIKEYRTYTKKKSLLASDIILSHRKKMIDFTNFPLWWS